MKHVLRNDAFAISFLESGDIERITYDKVMCINLYQANTLDGMISNLYLRFKDGSAYTRLLGANSPSSFKLGENEVYYEGSFQDVTYKIVLSLVNNCLYYTIWFNNLNKDIELYYTQDISLSYYRANEAYSSQYLDHSLSTNNAILTKQNQGPPFSLLTGSLNKTAGYSTDGLDFYGLNYKESNIPRAMEEGNLTNRIYQYELAMTAFKVNVTKGGDKKVTFFMDFSKNFKEEVRSYEAIKKEYEDLNIAPFPSDNSFIPCKRDYLIKPTLSLSANSYPESYKESEKDKEEVEKGDNGEIIAYFKQDHAHIVFKEKEKYLERPTASLMISNGYTDCPEKTFTNTSYMYGIFLSHVSFGNTDMNCFISTVKDPLNLIKTSGVRIYIKIGSTYRLLTMPSQFTMKASLSRWLYLLDDDEITIETLIDYSSPNIKLSFKSKNRRSYELLISNNLLIGPEESVNLIKPIFNNRQAEYHFDKNNLAGKYQSDYYFLIELDKHLDFVKNEEVFNQCSDLDNMQLIKGNASSFSITYRGMIENGFNKTAKINKIEKEYEKKFLDSIGNFKVESSDPVINKYNHLGYWYSHDALVHYASPHGLEQYSGAAWGTRDVLQGPVEFFKSHLDYQMIRKIILRVYARQFSDTFDWPQWFMFDNYSFIQAQDAHQDIIVWPLKVLSDYLKETDDLAILDELINYTDRNNAKPVLKDTLRKHVENQINNIKSSFIHGTHLPKYGNGDWDDTLQPVDKEKASRMVSCWTSALLIQALKNYSEVTGEYRGLLQSIQEDYKKYCIKDGIVAGFIRFDKDSIKYLLHPLDRETGLKYRLLPITRNIISEFTEKEEVEKYLRVIDEYLKYPDGVRLMDDTVKYHGGDSTTFVRAESAANFGREISLLYIHAHIRYIEAMAKYGDKDRVYEALNVINPIGIRKVLSNAEYRQSNSYFSSSDAEFTDRYIANKSISKIKTQEVKVKGGWRVYSSGPGIYLYELIANFFGIKMLHSRILIDPLLNKKQNNTTLLMDIDKKKLEIRYIIKGDKLSKLVLNGKHVGNREDNNIYRESGISFERSLLKKKNILEVLYE